MAFTVHDYQDLLQLLNAHPEWREELRRAVLQDDFLALPRVVRELAESQKRTDQQLQALTEAQQRTEQRLDDLTVRLEALTARVDDLAKRMEELIVSQSQMERQLKRNTDRLAQLDGRLLELEYREKVTAYFGKLLRRARAVNFYELEEQAEKSLTAEQLNDLMLLDLLVRGQWRQSQKGEQYPERWLGVEVSVVVDVEDVLRAARRVDWLRRMGLSAVAIAAGESLTKGAKEAAKKRGVILQTDGTMLFVEEALRPLLGEGQVL